jgi:3-dehydroquinate synthase
MKIVKVRLKKRSYDIIIGASILSLLGKRIKKLKLGCDAYVITNARLKNKYGKALSDALKSSQFNVRFKLVPDTEKSKSIATASRVIDDLTRYDRKKRIFIVAFGGGVIGDLAGFIASIYKRGVPYLQIPTTLLAQVDSAIGGKTAVDLIQGKNLIGAFYQPRLVFSDVRLLESLSPRQIRAGLAEVVKYALIKDAYLFDYLEKNYRKILGFNLKALESIIFRCSSIKARIVEQDEKEEKGIRTVLNFGHTLGHAIEAAGGYKKYNHGEAIAIGMLLAADLSKNLGLLNASVALRLEKLIQSFGLPIKISGVSVDKIIAKHYRDKKFSGSKNKFVLTRGIGRTQIKEAVALRAIREVLERRSQ